MVGGAAYYGGKKVQQGRENEADQEARLEALEAEQAASPPPQYAPPPPAAAPPPPAAAPAPAPAPAGGDDMVAQLERLKSLVDQGVLTPDEFTAAKQQVLQG
jgi:hypothetical protein